MSVLNPFFTCILVSLAACQGGEVASDTSVDDQSAGDSAHVGESLCEEAPLVTYANFGEGFLLANCQICHASTAADRHEAPESVTFDTVDQTWTWADRILDRTTGDDASMPPEGGVSEYDMELLTYWLGCGEEGT